MFKPCQIVVFKDPAPHEIDERFVVIEMRGDRVLVQAVNAYWRIRSISPQFVYDVDDLVEYRDETI